MHYIQNASTTCDEPIKKACDPKKNPIYLLIQAYLLTYAYLPI